MYFLNLNYGNYNHIVLWMVLPDLATGFGNLPGLLMLVCDLVNSFMVYIQVSKLASEVKETILL